MANRTLGYPNLDHPIKDIEVGGLENYEWVYKIVLWHIVRIIN